MRDVSSIGSGPQPAVSNVGSGSSSAGSSTKAAVSSEAAVSSGSQPGSTAESLAEGADAMEAIASQQVSVITVLYSVDSKVMGSRVMAEAADEVRS